jgi:hypothetical protein
MRVRITGCINDKAWYYGCTGLICDVDDKINGGYRIVSAGVNGLFINKADCEILPEPEQKLPVKISLDQVKKMYVWDGDVKPDNPGIRDVYCILPNRKALVYYNGLRYVYDHVEPTPEPKMRPMEDWEIRKIIRDGGAVKCKRNDDVFIDWDTVSLKSEHLITLQDGPDPIWQEMEVEE